MPGHVALHVGHFLRPLVDQQQDQLDVGIVGVDAAGDVLHQDRLAGARRGDDQPALAEADRGEDVDDARGQLGRVVLELDHRLGVERGRVVERDASRRTRRPGGPRSRRCGRGAGPGACRGGAGRAAASARG